MWESIKTISAILAPLLALGWAATAFLLSYRQRQKLQEVKLSHDAEMADMKKAHELDIAKRKYQYESRREEYVNFCNRLDEFASKGNRSFTERFPPLMQRLMGRILENPDDTAGPMSEFMDEMMAMTNEANEEHLRLKTETSKLRLVASESLRELLDELEQWAERQSTDVGNSMKAMCRPEVFGDPSALQEVQQVLEEPAKEIVKVREAIMEEMRSSLDSI